MAEYRRLRLVVRRHQLPELRVVFNACLDDNPTIAGLLKQVNATIPLQSDHWGLEDYIVELPGGGTGAGFECLHFQPVKAILEKDEEVLIRPVLTHDHKRRRMSFRQQISASGRHLIDGVPFGAQLLRNPTDRPDIYIPPLKRQRLALCTDKGQDSDRDTAPKSLRLTEHGEEDDDENDADFVSVINGEYEEENEDLSDEELTDELRGLMEESASHDLVVETRRLNRPYMTASEKTQESAGTESTDDFTSCNTDQDDDQLVDEADLNKINALQRAYPTAPIDACETHLFRSGMDIEKAYATLGKTFPAHLDIFSTVGILQSIKETADRDADSEDDKGSDSDSDAESVSSVIKHYNEHDFRAVSKVDDSASRYKAEELSKKGQGLEMLGHTKFDAQSNAISMNEEAFLNLSSNSARAEGSEVEDDANSSSSDNHSVPEGAALKDTQRLTETQNDDGQASSGLDLSSEESSDSDSSDANSDSSSSEGDSSGSDDNSDSEAESVSRTSTNLEPASYTTKSTSNEKKHVHQTQDASGVLKGGDNHLSREPSIVKVPPGEGLTKTKKRNARQRALAKVKKVEAEAQAVLKLKKSLLKSLFPQDVQTPARYGMDAGQFEASKSPRMLPRAGSVGVAENKRDGKLSEMEPTWKSKLEGKSEQEPEVEADRKMGARKESRAEPERQRLANLNIAAGRGMSLGGLGLQNLKTKADEANVSAPRMKGVQPLFNRRLSGEKVSPVTEAAQAAKNAEIVLETGKRESSRQTGGGDADREAWRNKITYRAVECSDEGIELSEPPFPFEKRWDRQQDYRSRKGRKRRCENAFKDADTRSGKRRKGSDSVYEGDDCPYDGHEVSTQNHNHEALAGTMELERYQLLEEDLPPLPQNPNTLPALRHHDIRVGLVITWQELQLTKTWEPEFHTITGAVVWCDTLDKSKVRVKLALRDLKRISRHKVYDEDGNRVYSKFDAPDVDSEIVVEGDGDYESGFRDLTFAQLLNPRILQRPVDSEPGVGDEALVDAETNTEALAVTEHTDQAKLTQDEAQNIQPTRIVGVSFTPISYGAPETNARDETRDEVQCNALAQPHVDPAHGKAREELLDGAPYDASKSAAKTSGSAHDTGMNTTAGMEFINEPSKPDHAEDIRLVLERAKTPVTSIDTHIAPSSSDLSDTASGDEEHDKVTEAGTGENLEATDGQMDDESVIPETNLDSFILDLNPAELHMLDESLQESAMSEERRHEMSMMIREAGCRDKVTRPHAERHKALDAKAGHISSPMSNSGPDRRAQQTDPSSIGSSGVYGGRQPAFDDTFDELCAPFEETRISTGANGSTRRIEPTPRRQSARTSRQEPAQDSDSASVHETQHIGQDNEADGSDDSIHASASPRRSVKHLVPVKGEMEDRRPEKEEAAQLGRKRTQRHQRRSILEASPLQRSKSLTSSSSNCSIEKESGSTSVPRKSAAKQKKRSVTLHMQKQNALPETPKNIAKALPSSTRRSKGSAKRSIPAGAEILAISSDSDNHCHGTGSEKGSAHANSEEIPPPEFNYAENYADSDIDETYDEGRKKKNRGPEKVLGREAVTPRLTRSSLPASSQRSSQDAGSGLRGSSTGGPSGAQRWSIGGMSGSQSKRGGKFPIKRGGNGKGKMLGRTS